MHRVVLLALFVLIGILSVLAWAVSEGPQSECVIIDASGSYSLANDITGAPFDTSLGGKTCILITASNVTFDCNGFTILGDGFSGSGIFLDGPLSNVRVRNCQVDGYRDNVYVYRSSGNIISNNSVSASNNNAFTADFSSSNTFDGNTVHNSFGGFVSTFSFDNNFTNNDVYVTASPFQLQSSSRNYYFNNNISDGGSTGFFLSGSSDNRISKTSMKGIFGWGAQLISADNNVFENNIFPGSIYNNAELGFSNNNVFSKNNFSNANTSVYIASSNSNIFSNNNVSDNYFAFDLIESNSNTFSGNKVSNNVIAFFIESNSGSNTLGSNEIFNNTNGLWILSSNNAFNGNNVYNTEENAFYFRNSSFNSISNNQVYENIKSAFSFESSSQNTISENTIYNSRNGLEFISSSFRNNITRNDISNNSRFGIFFESSADGNSVSQNAIFNNQFSGISMEFSSNNVTDNFVFGNAEVGLFLIGASKSTFSRNTLYNNFFAGIIVFNSSDNIISDNIVYENNPANVTFFGSLVGGIGLIEGSSNNLMRNNVIYNNSQYGIGFIRSPNNIITFNTVTNSSTWGLYVDNSDNNKFSNNDINNQRTGTGFYITNSAGNVLENEHFYRNGNDFFINATRAVDIKLIKVVFDASEGKYENNTMLSINDSLKAIDSYSIKWATNTSTTKIPANTFTLYKFINMTTSYPYLEIDSIFWHWTDKDVQDADEKSIQLWLYNTSWSLMENFTLNTTTNSLNVSKVNASFYGLVYANATPADCRYVSISINFTPACDGNNVIVSAGGNLLSLANVTVIKDGNVIASGLTDSAGKFTFNGTGQTVDMYIEKTRTPDTCYSVPGAGKFTINLKNPADCGRPECVVNSDCPSGQVCTSNKCTPSAAPECTKDADCQNGRICQNGKCVEQQPPTGGCTSDDNCTAEQYCSAGSCTAVATGACGHIVNHAWVSYECCADADCSGGQSCKDNKCAGVNYELTGPSMGYVGDTISFTAYLNSEPLADADVKVTMPDGSFEMLTTDSSGNASFQVGETGAYVIDLIVNDNVAYTTVLTSVSGSAIPTGFPMTLDFWVQAGVLLVFAVIILAVLAFLVYFFFLRGRTAKKIAKKRKKKEKKAAEEAEMPTESGE